MNGEFSYPVLNDDNNDYLNSTFKAEIDIAKSQINPNFIAINVIFSLDEPSLAKLVTDGKAVFILHIEGKNSSYREVFQATKNSYYIQATIDTSLASERLEVNTLLIANTDIPELISSRFNSDFYKDFTFGDIRKGQILAFNSTHILKLDFQNNEKHEGTPPMEFRATTDPFYSFSFDSDDIIVELPKKSFQIYKELSNSTEAQRNMFLATFVIPALAQAIDILQNGKGDDNLWEDTIRYKLKTLGINDLHLNNYPSLQLAQLIIGNPLDAILVHYKNYFERGDN